MKNDLMLIGEIADFFGISRKAIRLYEKKGIIKPIKVDASNGYRYYSAELRKCHHPVINESVPYEQNH